MSKSIEKLGPIVQKLREQIYPSALKAQKFAKGGDFITNKPELIMVGEAGREHVQITPVDRPQEKALKGSGVTINIEGGVVDQDYVVNTLIPAINASGQTIA